MITIIIMVTVMPIIAMAEIMDYLKDPAAIYRLSFERVRAATDLSAIPADLHDLALRLVHTTADPQIVADLAFSKGAGQAGRHALAKGATILADCQMAAAGVIRQRLAGNRVLCTLHEDGIAAEAKALGTTRSAAAVDRWLPFLAGAVVTIGNAPTALFRLLELLDQGVPKPALILGFPVGFVGAAESKQALIERAGSVPYVTLKGRRGGSPMAAAAINALSGPAP